MTTLQEQLDKANADWDKANADRRKARDEWLEDWGKALDEVARIEKLIKEQSHD